MTSASPDVVVIGGGVAGLACATRLRECDIDVILLERDRLPGGNVRTTIEEGYRLERGPHTFLGSADAIFDLVDSAGLQEDLLSPRPEAKARFIARNGKLHAAPTGPLSFLTSSLLSFRSKMTLATEPFRRSKGNEEDTAALFFKRRFGEEAAQIIAGAFISGVYAGDPEQLSAPAAFPLFWGFEQETGSMIRGAMRHGRRRRREAADQGRSLRKGLFSFDGGLGGLTQAMAEALGERCHLDVEVLEVVPTGQGYEVYSEGCTWRSRSVVVATPPQGAAKVLGGSDAKVAELLDGVPMAPIAVVHLGFDERLEKIPEGFGFLVPRSEGHRTLGVLFPSRLFNGRAPEQGDLLTGFVGGMKDPEALELNDHDLVEIVRSDLATLTSLRVKPSFHRVRRYPQAIPQLVVGHQERLEQVRQRLASHKGLLLAGNYLRGVGMKDAAASGLEAAQTILKLT